jgi:hypothetical protein
MIDAALVMAGQSPIGPEDGLGASAAPPVLDPAITVAARFLAAEKAYRKALERRAHEETLGREASGATYAAGDAAMHAADAARSALAALLDAVALSDDSELPSEMYVNADAGKSVNDFMGHLAKVLREAST